MITLKNLTNWKKLISGRKEFEWVNNLVEKLSNVPIIEMTQNENVIIRPRNKKECSRTPDCYLGVNVYVSNPYIGCVHGCSYCYAQYFKDIKDREKLEPIYVRKNFAQMVCDEISRKPSLKNKIINFGSATDPYQPLELHYRFFRRIIPFFREHDLWFYLATKSNLVIRDIDLLKGYEKAWIGIILTSLDDNIMKIFEPNRPSSSLVLDAIKSLTEANIKVVVRIDPLIPGVNDNLDFLRNMIDILKSIGVKAITAGILKAKFAMLQSKGYQQPIWRKPWYQSISEYKEKTGLDIEKVINEGFTEDYPYGYKIPPLTERLKMLAPIAEYATSHGISFSVCEMGMNLIEALGSNCSRFCACVYGVKENR